MMRFLIVALFLLMSSFLYSFQDDWDDDDWGDVIELEMVKGETKKQNTIKNYWDEHIYGSISATYSSGENHSRYGSEFKIGYNDHFKNLKFVFEGALRQNTVITDVETTNWYTDEAYTQEVTLKSEYLEVRQLYVDYYPIDKFLFSFGKQTLVWGQLEIFSPIDFLLPLDFSPTGFSMMKADNRMPQTSFKVAYYPTNQVELIGYYFPYFEESPLFQTVDYSTFYDVVDGEIVYWKKQIPSGDDQSSYALRAMWYSSHFTTGLTYYDGYNNNFPIYKSRAIQVENFSSYDYITEYGYFSKKAIGYELNIPLGDWNLKFDAAISEDYVMVSSYSSEFAELLLTYNNGYDQIPSYMGFYTIGIDADFDDWFYNFYLMSIQYYEHPAYSEFWSLYRQAYLNEQYDEFFWPSVPLFPTFNIGRYFTSEKKGGYGLAFGYFSSSFGFLLYMSNQISESLSWGVSLDVIASFSDYSLISAQNDDSETEGEYKEYKFTEPKITFGLGYLL